MDQRRQPVQLDQSVGRQVDHPERHVHVMDWEGRQIRVAVCNQSHQRVVLGTQRVPAPNPGVRSVAKGRPDREMRVPSVHTMIVGEPRLEKRLGGISLVLPHRNPIQLTKRRPETCQHVCPVLFQRPPPSRGGSKRGVGRENQSLEVRSLGPERSKNARGLSLERGLREIQTRIIVVLFLILLGDRFRGKECGKQRGERVGRGVDDRKGRENLLLGGGHWWSEQMGGIPFQEWWDRMGGVGIIQNGVHKEVER